MHSSTIILNPRGVDCRNVDLDTANQLAAWAIVYIHGNEEIQEAQKLKEKVGVPT